MRTALLLFLAALLPAPAMAANQVALDNSVFVERVTTDATGKQRVLLEEPKVVVPGDRLVFVLNYRNAGAQAADKFVITNPMPSAVRFSDAGETQPLVSVDGGRQWGLLSDLTVATTDGSRRAAQPGDVTHIRWAFQKPIPAGASGKLMFRGVVK
ncbi:MAG: hypothetical protein DI569_09710 [Sphingopyxis macrogoltabida]|uniref:DUF11 domain-containing protein n=1 Tax=Sphingopyxis macrogoltabida TaxID=33050 RepID=A0A2W5N774_SPHMC|nr:MAG: hypothetical protein DI569_09710 [Sphingopyxis macrogoltabida]